MAPYTFFYPLKHFSLALAGGDKRDVLYRVDDLDYAVADRSGRCVATAREAEPSEDPKIIGVIERRIRDGYGDLVTVADVGPSALIRGELFDCATSWGWIRET
jgi:hypothetical protein